MSHLARYLRTHLSGATAGVDLFDRAAHGLPEPDASVVRRIHSQLVMERATLRGTMLALGIHENPVLTALAATGERIGRLKPNGDLLHRTPMTDLVELEAMRIVLAGKLARWEALRAIADGDPRLDRSEIERLAEQTREQQQAIRRLHSSAAARALGRGVRLGA